MKCLKIVFSALLVLCLLFSVVNAHSGKTDSKGGHRDSSTGEYHYHHGYPAHQHTNGICPYDFVDKTNGGSSSASSSSVPSTTPTPDPIVVVETEPSYAGWIVSAGVIVIFAVSSHRSRVRSNASKDEIESLSAQLKLLHQENIQLNTTINSMSSRDIPVFCYNPVTRKLEEVPRSLLKAHVDQLSAIYEFNRKSCLFYDPVQHCIKRIHVDEIPRLRDYYVSAAHHHIPPPPAPTPTKSSDHLDAVISDIEKYGHP